MSTDGGHTWAKAEFFDPVQRHAWRRWKFAWLTPKKPGHYTLLARAKDANGSVQPDTHDPNYDSYVINHPLPIEVFVGDPPNTSLSVIDLVAIVTVMFGFALAAYLVDIQDVHGIPMRRRTYGSAGHRLWNDPCFSQR